MESRKRMEACTTALTTGVILAAGFVIDQNTLVPLGTIGAAMLGMLWIGRKYQRIEDRLDDLGAGQQIIHSRIAKLPCKDSTCSRLAAPAKPEHTA